MDTQSAERRSFIEQARRAQIVGAAVETLAEVGYVNASLARIAKRAGISPSLIPYHFADKESLMHQTVSEISEAWDAHVRRQVAEGNSAADKLRRYIRASLGYMAERPARFAALIEIAFNARDKSGVLLYRSEEEEAGQMLLEELLTQGQRTGEFRRFNARHLATAIRGAVNEFFGGMHRPGADAEAYAADLAELFVRVAAKR